MMWAWFLTLPVTAVLSYLAVMVSRYFGWIQ
jgi:phosphate/sulfate permease